MLSYFCGLQLCAQQAHFSQYYSAPLYINPAHTGNTEQSRFALAYRLQWPAIPGAFQTSYASYDVNLSSINSGLGVMVLDDRSGSGALSFTSVHATYAYNIAFNRKVFARAGLGVGYNQRVLDVTRLTFTDQLLRGGGVATAENVTSLSTRFVNFKLGGILYTRKSWLGVSLSNINKPNESLLNTTATLPNLFFLEMGHVTSLKKTVKRKDAKLLTTALHYRAQDKFDQLDFGLYYTQYPIFFGLWYRGLPLIKSYQKGYANNDAVIAIFGLDYRFLKISYSYDLTVSRLAANTGGSHELGLTYEYVDPRKRKRKKRSYRFNVPCAKF